MAKSTHHLLAEELGDALDVRGFAAAGAGVAVLWLPTLWRQLEQGLCVVCRRLGRQLAVLDVGELVDEVC